MTVFITNNVWLLSIQIAAVLILPATRIQISSGLSELLRERLYANWKWCFVDISVLYFITKILEDSVHVKCPKSHNHFLGRFPAQFSPRGNVWHCLFLQIYGPYFTEFTELIYKTFHSVLCGVCCCAPRIFKETGLLRPKTKTALNSSKTSSVSVPRTFKFRFREL